MLESGHQVIMHEVQSFHLILFRFDNLVLSMPYKWWNAFNSKTKNVTQTIEDHIPEKHLEQLYDNFPEFRKIYDQDTMTASKYSNLEPAIHTLLQFAGGLDQVCHIVRQNMLK